MCAIIGLIGCKGQQARVKEGLAVLKSRGKDAQEIADKGNVSIGHALHSIVGFVPQPFSGKGIFAANCEIYNWKELEKKYRMTARNDAELIFRLLEDGKDIKTLIEELDGVFAFAYHCNRTLWLARDLIGEKPLWYSADAGFAFASEKKALAKIGFRNIQELNPRQLLEFNSATKKVTFHRRKFFALAPEVKDSGESIRLQLSALLHGSVKKRVPGKKFGLLFSGGLDSSLLALLLKKIGKKFTCYTVVIDHPGFKEPEDLGYAKKAAQALQLNHKIIKVKLSELEGLLKTVVPLIEDSNVVKAGVALTFFKACQAASKDGCKVLFSGLGAEELFAGYQRHKNSSDINKECLSGLLKMYERDLYRDDVVSMYNSIELRLPFLDKKLCQFALLIPGEYKIVGNVEKKILRDVAKRMGLPDFIAERKKRAAQYGSNMHKALEKLAKKNNHPTISSYLGTFSQETNPKLGALISGGKDSIFAMHTMMRQNYPVKCMITLRSANPDSYMFHTPTISLTKLQARAIGLPLVTVATSGDKERELADLKKALQKAKERYGIEGVVSGALYSDYQRDRIEKICDSLGLKIFSPLWHIDQEKEVCAIMSSGFRFIMTKVAAEGLDDSWLNRPIAEKDISALAALRTKIGINIAGEGGEYETLVLDGPIFRKKIRIMDAAITRESHSAVLKVKKAVLEEKC